MPPLKFILFSTITGFFYYPKKNYYPQIFFYPAITMRPDWTVFHRPTKRLTSLGIMGGHIEDPT